VEIENFDSLHLVITMRGREETITLARREKIDR